MEETGRIRNIKIPTFRFSWLEYYLKKNILLKIWQFCLGTLFLHSRQIAFYLFSHLSFEKTDLILDIGSGDGNFDNWISYHAGRKVVGIDRVLSRIQKSRDVAKKYKLPNEFICLDVEKEKIDFPEKKFDKILIIDTLEHLENPQRILYLSRKWLKKGKSLFISTPALSQNRVFLHSYQDFFSYGKDYHYFEGFEIKTLQKWLREAGFTGKIETRYIFYKIYQLTWEISELIRKRSKTFYSLLIPVFLLFAFADRIFPLGKRGNGIILIAQK